MARGGVDERVRSGAQRAIAGLVTAGVVDLLQIVDVAEHESGHARAGRRRERVLERPLDRAPAGDPGSESVYASASTCANSSARWMAPTSWSAIARRKPASLGQARLAGSGEYLELTPGHPVEDHPDREARLLSELREQVAEGGVDVGIVDRGDHELSSPIRRMRLG